MPGLIYTKEAINNLAALKKAGEVKKLKKIKAALEKLEQNPRHPGLHTHKYQTLKTKTGGEVFQSYVENKTPAAYRIFWHFGPDDNQITVIAIVKHP